MVETVNWRRVAGRLRELGEHTVGERAEDLGDLDRVCARVALHLLVLDSLEHAGIKALVEHDFLEVQDHPVDRVVPSSAGEEAVVLP